MSLSQAQMDAMDETPNRRLGGRINSFELAETRRRSVSKPAWRVAADDRWAQLELLADVIEREERCEP
jgi:hypothetical protein